jgi:DNA replication protein DnaC
MTNMLKTRLRDMKLAGIANSIDERISYANQQQLSYGQFLELLFEDEENNRRDNSYKKRYARAKFPAHKIIEEFDFNFQPSIDKRQINDAPDLSVYYRKKKYSFYRLSWYWKNSSCYISWNKSIT